MDQHPIPQNVTGFQFKLIGSMTVKQFGYLAVGIVTAVIIYYLPLRGLVAIFLKIILIPFFGASGAIFAFVPVDGRPIDIMATNFFKAIFSPNQYVYHKGLKRFSFSTIQMHAISSKSTSTPRSLNTQKQQAAIDKGHALQKILTKDSLGKINNAQDEKEAEFLKTFLAAPIQPQAQSLPIMRSQATQTAQPAISPTQNLTLLQIPSEGLPKKSAETSVASTTTDEAVLSQKEAAVKKQLDFAKQEEAKSTLLEQNAVHQKTLGLESQLKEIHDQKMQLEQEIINLKNQLTSQRAAVAATPTAPTAVAVPPAKPVAPLGHVRSVPQEMNKRLGLLVSDTPNVVTGTVKDARGNVLPNILVEVKDKSGNPVRAFKTNTLGNFASATPLATGTYTITLEDLKKEHTFDSIQITASGQIMLPIEIISYDKREALRKELFNQ